MYTRGIYMEETEVVSFKVSKRFKAEMKKIDINWSEYIRQCVQKKMDHEKKIVAFKQLDEIRKRSKPVSEEELMNWIREGRER
jgi:hypothetical protein